jgi:hypothetical protein
MSGDALAVLAELLRALDSGDDARIERAWASARETVDKTPPIPPFSLRQQLVGRARVVGAEATRDEHTGTVMLTLTTPLQPYEFEVAGADASALGHALKLLSPYGDSDALRMAQERDTLARALQILGLEPETPR